MTSKLINLKTLDDASVDRAVDYCERQNPSDFMWKDICQSQIKATQSLRTAYVSDIK